MIDVTIPADPVAAGLARWGDDNFTPFGNPYVAVATEINGRHYALVTSDSQASLQIIDITNPYSLSAVTTFKTSSLHNYYGVEVMESGGHHYALVSIRSFLTDPSIEQLLVINITDPSVPSLVKTVSSGGTSDFAEFNTMLWMQVMQAASRDYVLMPGTGLNRLSVVDLTDPLNPSNPFLPHLRLDLGEGGDGYATYDRQENGGRTLVFQYVTGPGDHTPDLSYDGQDALQMGRTVLLNANGTLLPQVVLPEPGAPDSLSDSKQISIYGTDPREHFVTTWEVPSAGDSITLPAAQASGTYTVYWGDGKADYGISGDATHEYVEAGNYTVSTHNLDRIRLGADAAGAAMLRSIDSWGTTRWTSMSEAFRGASSMTHAADDVPDLSDVRSMAQMFSDSSIMDGLSGWNVSSVEEMSSVFRGAAVFDGNVSGWDVSSARDISSMFRGASSFNQDISGWSTSSVEDISHMFQDAQLFNQDISGWSTSSVEDTSYMFQDAQLFNQDISGWSTSSVEDTSYMFQNASSFNQDVSGWDVSSVKDMTSMFDGATSFVQNLGRWYVTVEDTSINGADVPGIVGGIMAQNTFLDAQNPVYGIGAGADSAHFVVLGDALAMISVDGTETRYVANITASGLTVFGDGNNWKTVDVTVQGGVPSTSLSVDAGISQNVIEGATVTLSGSATGAPPDTLMYMWSQTSSTPPQQQIDLDDDSMPTITFTAPQVSSETTFVFTLDVTDGTDSASDLVAVTVRGAAMGSTTLTVHAESRHAAYAGDTVTLTGSAVDAPPGPLTYMWSQMLSQSQQIPLGNTSAQVVTFVAPQVNSDTQFMFTLTATVGDSSASDPVSVTVKSRPASDPDTVIVSDQSIPQIVSGQNLPRTGSGTGFVILPPAVTIGSLGYPESSVPASIRNALPDIGAPVTPIQTDNTFDFPLEVNGQGYALRHHSSTLVPQNLLTGQPVSIAVTLYDRYEISRFAVYLNLQDSRTSYLESDTHVAYDGRTIRVADPGDLMSDVSISILQDPYDSKKTAVLNATFSEKVGTTNMVIRTSNERGGTATITVIDALRVIPIVDPEPVDRMPDAEPVEPESLAESWSRDGDSSSSSSEGGMLAIRMWSGFEPESITYAELLHVLGLTGYRDADIPRWVMTELGPLASKNLITVEQFRTALQYVIENL